MRKIRQALRLFYEMKLSRRRVAKSLGISRDAVADYITRFQAARLTWPLLDDIDDAELEQRLFPANPASRKKHKPEPDWAKVHQELKRGKGGTLMVLHQEYLAEHPDGMSYSMFCRGHYVYVKLLKGYLRRIYVAGERVEVDFAGPTVPIIDPRSGFKRHAQIFVAVLSASKYTYVEAVWSQSLPDWIGAHVRMFAFFGGVTVVIVCDNLKSAITKACRTDPVVNATYQNLADHYGTSILAARPGEPRDKSKAENGVLLVERWLLFRLRKRVFASLAELNIALSELLVDLNGRKFQKLPGSRRESFETIDLPALMPLPPAPFVYAEFHKKRVGQDYHVEFEGCYYSVPWKMKNKEVDLRVTAGTLEVLYKGQRVASHVRHTMGTGKVTVPAHMDPAHSYFALWRAEDAMAWAEQSGSNVRAFMEILLANTKTQEQGYRTQKSLNKLLSEFGEERLDKACRRAIEIGATTTSSVRSILKKHLENAQAEEQEEFDFMHGNIRGPGYYK